MRENSVTKRLYDIKEYMTRHTGLFGKGIEYLVARHWVKNVENTVDYKQKADLGKKPVDSNSSECKIAIVVYSLIIGGGEIFPIQLANALSSMGEEVTLINCNVEPSDLKVQNMIDPGVNVINLKGLEELGYILSSHNYNIVHSHHAMIDLAVSKLITAKRIKGKQVVTLHGMYEALDVPRRNMIIKRVSKTCIKFAYIADKNLQCFKQAGLFNKNQFQRIPNGMPVYHGDRIDRKELGIPENAFVLCLVSRARHEKGWKEAIEAVNMANINSKKPIHLLLVGEGEAYDELLHLEGRFIHFTGSQENTRAYFSTADLGFLPSRYSGESFPLVVIDSLMCGKPVLATNLGEIRRMLTIGEGKMAGWTFDLINGLIPVEELSKIICKIANSPNEYNSAKILCCRAAGRFDILNVAGKYRDLYRETITKSPKTERQNKNIKIFIVCHKPSITLKSEILKPIQVGCQLNETRLPGMYHDDEGDNISEKNPMYCEMTAQYWAWKNIEADYYGFFHYRRYLNFSGKTFRTDKYDNIYEPSIHGNFKRKYGLTDYNISAVLRKYDIVTIKPRIDLSVKEQYRDAEHLQLKDLITIVEIIDELYPEYSETAHQYLNGKTAYYCNMYVMKKEIFHNYCRWVFSILDEFCKRTDMQQYDKDALRTPGHLAERLWGIYYTWLKENRQYRAKEVQCIVVSHTEASSLIEKILPIDIVRLLYYRLFHY